MVYSIERRCFNIKIKQMTKEQIKRMVNLPKSPNEWVYALTHEFKNVSFEQKIKKFIEVIIENKEMTQGRGDRFVQEAEKAMITKDVTKLVDMLEKI